MKTTIEISDSILMEAKDAARKNKTTLRGIVESALRRYLNDKTEHSEPYKLEKHSFMGDGVCEGIQEGQWEEIRAMIYEGRGG